MKITIESLFKNSNEICQHINDNDVPKDLIIKSLIITFICGMIYGFTMGIYNSIFQSISSGIKVPILFLSTLLICMPPLHFIGLLFGSKLKIFQSISIVLWGISISMILLSAFSFVILFFLLTHSSYKFILILHVLIFTFSGSAGLFYIKRSFVKLKEIETRNDPSVPKKSNSFVLFLWMFLYMFIGTQMAYLLSPFIGTDQTFILFTGTDKNFYSYLFGIIFK